MRFPAKSDLERVLLEKALQPLLAEVNTERQKQIDLTERHVEISLNEIINRANLQAAHLIQQQESGQAESGVEGRLKQFEDRLDELNHRLERRRAELQREREVAIGDILHLGAAWVLPHPERAAPGIAPMVRDEEIERLAVQAAIAYEEARGWQVESVETENRGFDLVSRKPHPEDAQTSIDVRFIEVKGRAGVGEVALTMNEYRTAERLKKDFWLYAVFNCSAKPEVHAIQDPVRLGWEAVVKVEHYHVGAEQILRVRS